MIEFPTWNPRSDPVSDSLVHSQTFSNGLVLLAEEMPGLQSAAFSFLIPAGAAFERADRAGTASMLAEWITRGAGKRDSRAILSDLDNLGVSHAESASGVHVSMSAATLGANLIPALEIFADIALQPTLDEEEVEPIRALTLQGLRSLEDDPGSKVIFELRKRHFPDPWGRPSPGTPEGVEAISGDDLRLFHQTQFKPNGAILAVAGALNWPELVEAVERLFGTWQTKPEPIVKLTTTGPTRDHILRETQQIQIALAYPTVLVNSPDYYCARAATAILGGYASARLFTEVREKRGLCYSVYASYESLPDRAAVLCYAGTSADRAQETLDVTLDEIRKLAALGVDGEELDMMRAGLKSSLIMQQESSMGRSGSLASDWYYLSRIRPLEEISASLDALTPEAVSANAAATAGKNMTILTLGPNPLTFNEEA